MWMYVCIYTFIGFAHLVSPRFSSSYFILKLLLSQLSFLFVVCRYSCVCVCVQHAAFNVITLDTYFPTFCYVTVKLLLTVTQDNKLKWFHWFCLSRPVHASKSICQLHTLQKSIKFSTGSKLFLLTILKFVWIRW